MKRFLFVELPRRYTERARHTYYRSAIWGWRANDRAIVEFLTTAYKPVRAPLILISQVPRSGGTLLSQLFDNHPQVLAHPGELKIGYPNKEIWPPIGPHVADEEKFRRLFELNSIRFCETGYAKGPRAKERRAFHFLPRAQRRIFLHMFAADDRVDERAVLDAYFTSYFNAWLNLRAYIDRAQWVSGFVPTLISDQNNMDRFWAAYPDGYLISILRSPLTWFPSVANVRSGKKRAVERESAHWRTSVESMLREKRRRPDRVILIHFDDLLSKTEKVMRGICDRIGLAFDPTLLSPTFNGDPIEANTRFDSLPPGQVSSVPIRRDEALSDADRSYLTKHCLPLYQRALAQCETAGTSLMAHGAPLGALGGE